MHSCAGRAAPRRLPLLFVLFLLRTCLEVVGRSRATSHRTSPLIHHQYFAIARNQQRPIDRAYRAVSLSLSLSALSLSLSLLGPTHSRVVSRVFGGGASTWRSRRATSSVFLAAGPQHAPSRFHPLVPSRSVLLSLSLSPAAPRLCDAPNRTNEGSARARRA